MAADTIYTYDQSPALRPTLDKLGGAGYVNATPPPDPATMPNALEYVQKSNNLAGLNRVCPVALLYITFPAGVATLSGLSAMGTTIVGGTFTLTHSSAGDLSITWGATVFPTALVPPMVSLAQDLEIETIRAFPITNGVHVKTKIGAGTGTDAAFVLAIY